MQIQGSSETIHADSCTLTEAESGEPILLQEVKNVLGSSDRQVKSKIRWEWNLRLLGVSVGLVTGLLLIALIVHTIQARRVAEGLSNLAKKAMAQQDHAMEIKWLNQLVAFDFRYDRALERLAIASNRSIDTIAEVDQARQSLIRAMASLDENDDQERIRSLRRLLVQRLLEMPATWAMEAEKQILLLDANPEDHEALRWLALSLFIQVENGEWRPREKKRFDRDKEFWNWMSCQSVGDVLEAAEKANPKAIDLKIALASTYVERPELFDLPLDEANKARLKEKAIRVVVDLQSQDDGRAQWACYSFSEKLGEQQIENLLTQMSSRAVDRLLSPVDPSSKNDRLDIRPATRYWDLAIGMARAAKWDAEGRVQEADALYQRLITVDKSQVPEQQLADLYLQLGRSQSRRGEIPSALATLRKGCKETSPASALELWELIAVIQCRQGDPEQASSALGDLELAAQNARNQYLASPIRDAIREKELKRLAQIRWHAALLRTEQTLMINPTWDKIQGLIELLQTQQDIAGNLRLKAYFLLADTYARIGFWDMEARALEDALNLVPDNQSIRKRVADAWLKAGLLSRAESQLKLADDGSFSASLQHLQVMLEIQRSVPMSLRRMDRLRQLQKQTRQRLLKEKESSQSHERAWMFELIEITRAVDSLESNDLELGLESEKGLAQLVTAYPDNAELQSMAARSFAAAGKAEPTAIALSHLERMKSKAPEMWFETNLKIQLQQKRIDEARQFIKRVVEDDIIPRLQINLMAARAFADAGELEESCRILLDSWETNDATYLFFLANQLLQATLDEDRQSDQESSTRELSKALEEIVARVQKIEGPRGTLSQYLQAAMLLRTAQRDGKTSELDNASKMIRRVIEARPRWMEGLKLCGDIRAAIGDAEGAVNYYQRAIAEGDSRVATTFLLAQQLSQLGRFSEAEVEFQRISHLGHSSRAITEFAVGLEQRQGNDAKALELAREATSRHPKDASAWLIHAQAALIRHGYAADAGSGLLDEAEECLRKANELTRGADLSVWLSQLRVASRFRGPEATQALIDELRQSRLSEKSKGLLSAQAYVGLQDYTKAIESLSVSARSFPYDVDILNALVEAYRLSGQPDQALEALEKAYRLNPKRSDVARSLAIMLATQTSSGNSAQWNRIGSIVEGIEAQSSDARSLFLAFLMVTRGADSQHVQALSLLGDLVLSSERGVAEDALRLSIAIHRKNWEVAKKQKHEQQMLVEQQEIQRLFEILWRTPERAALINDLYQHVDFLLQAGERKRVAEWNDEFDRIAPGSPMLLNLRFQLALAEGKTSGLPDKVREWVGDAQQRRNAPLLAEAGRLLSEQGFPVESLPYLEAAYHVDSQWLRPLIVGLSRAERLEDALKLCVERYHAEPNIETISLLTDLAILSVGRSPLDPRVDQMVEESLTRFSSSPKLLELVGTLRLFQQRYRESFELLTRAEKLAPSSIVTLNNLAVAASEIPGKEREGLAKIEKAIDLNGSTPDLLDTLGTVQLACNLAEKAEVSLRKSLDEKPDSRTLLHLLQSLQSQGKTSEVRERLRSFRLSDLRGMVLTVREQQAIEALRQTYDLATHDEASS
jgi:tetratricopeptide (TPR) repeat protein